MGALPLFLSHRLTAACSRRDSHVMDKEIERTSRLVQVVTVTWRKLPDTGDADSLEQVMSGASQVLLHYLQEFGDIQDVDVTPLAWMDLNPAVADKHTAR